MSDPAKTAQADPPLRAQQSTPSASSGSPHAAAPAAHEFLLSRMSELRNVLRIRHGFDIDQVLGSYEPSQLTFVRPMQYFTAFRTERAPGLFISLRHGKSRRVTCVIAVDQRDALHHGKGKGQNQFKARGPVQSFLLPAGFTDLSDTLTIRVSDLLLRAVKHSPISLQNLEMRHKHFLVRLAIREALLDTKFSSRRVKLNPVQWSIREGQLVVRCRSSIIVPSNGNIEPVEFFISSGDLSSSFTVPHIDRIYELPGDNSSDLAGVEAFPDLIRDHLYMSACYAQTLLNDSVMTLSELKGWIKLLVAFLGGLNVNPLLQPAIDPYPRPTVSETMYFDMELSLDEATINYSPTPLLTGLLSDQSEEFQTMLKTPIQVLNTRYARARAAQAFFEASLVSRNYKLAYYALCYAADMGRRSSGWGVPNPVNVHSNSDPNSSRKLALCSACNSLKLCTALSVVASTGQLKCSPCAAKYKGMPVGTKVRKGTPSGSKGPKGISTHVLRKELGRLGLTKAEKKTKMDEFKRHVDGLAVSVNDKGLRTFKDIYFNMERVERGALDDRSPYQASMDAIDPVTLQGRQARIHVPHNMGPTALYGNLFKWCHPKSVLPLWHMLKMAMTRLQKSLDTQVERDIKKSRKAVDEIVLRFHHCYLIGMQLDWKATSRLAMNLTEQRLGVLRRQWSTAIVDVNECQYIRYVWRLVGSRHAGSTTDMLSVKCPRYDEVQATVAGAEQHYNNQVPKINGTCYPFGRPQMAAARKEPLAWSKHLLYHYFSLRLEILEWDCDRYFDTSVDVPRFIALVCILFLQPLQENQDALREHIVPYKRHPLAMSLGHANHSMPMEFGLPTDFETFQDFQPNECNIALETWMFNAMKGDADTRAYSVQDILTDSETLRLDNPPHWRWPLPLHVPNIPDVPWRTKLAGQAIRTELDLDEEDAIEDSELSEDEDEEEDETEDEDETDVTSPQNDGGAIFVPISPNAGASARTGTASGLFNSGNTCFMNSILQILGRTPLIADNIGDLMQDGYTVDALADLLLALWKNDLPDAEKKLRVYNEELLFDADRDRFLGLDTATMNFVPGVARQQDAAEFLLEGPGKNHEIGPIFGKLTDMRIEESLECHTCHATRSTTLLQDGILDISLDDFSEDDCPSVDDLLDRHTRAELVIGGIANCPSDICKDGRRDAMKSSQYAFGSMLVINLKRLVYDVSTKTTKKRQVTVIMQEHLRNNGVNYRLQAIARHIGAGGDSGHWVADIYNEGKDSWVTYDDNQIRTLQDPPYTHPSATAALVFYVKDKDQDDNMADLHTATDPSQNDNEKDAVQPTIEKLRLEVQQLTSKLGISQAALATAPAPLQLRTTQDQSSPETLTHLQPNVDDLQKQHQISMDKLAEEKNLLSAELKSANLQIENLRSQLNAATQDQAELYSISALRFQDAKLKEREEKCRADEKRLNTAELKSLEMDVERAKHWQHLQAYSEENFARRQQINVDESALRAQEHQIQMTFEEQRAALQEQQVTIQEQQDQIKLLTDQRNDSEFQADRLSTLYTDALRASMNAERRIEMLESRRTSAASQMRRSAHGSPEISRQGSPLPRPHSRSVSSPRPTQWSRRVSMPTMPLHRSASQDFGPLPQPGFLHLGHQPGPAHQFPGMGMTSMLHATTQGQANQGPLPGVGQLLNLQPNPQSTGQAGGGNDPGQRGGGNIQYSNQGDGNQ